MALTNTQYESIMRGYESRRTAGRRREIQRRDTVYAQVPGFRELEDASGRLSLSCARRLLDGEDAPLEELRRALLDLSSRKKELLVRHGFPPDYLEPAYECPDCQDTGYRKPETPDGVLTEKCHCLRRQEVALLYEQSNIQEMIQHENFSTLSLEYYKGEDLARFRNAVNVSREFARQLPEAYRNLFFYGTVGVGKSFLSGCIANELLQKGRSVIYFSCAGLFETLARYAFDAKGKETLSNFCKDLYHCDLVILDDLGTEVTNAFVTSQLFSCLNERHLGRKSTLISTNLSLEELRDRYSDRIFSRITSNFQICKLSGPDVRMYKKRMANRK
ncbi:MAG: ATP-binding protein [Clostridium sp.]|jgi:DNA replication protein DnaC|nr:ATP-binding protein [Clostridium sp.]